MLTVAVVGAGDLGGAVARALAGADGVGRVVLVDTPGAAAAGKALDIAQAGPVAGFHTRLTGTDELSRVTGCAACVVADRFGSNQEWSGEEGLALLGRLAPALSGVPIIFAGARQATLMERAFVELGLPRAQLIGSAPEALRSAVQAMVALETHRSPSEVAVSVLGRPPSGFVVPWSEATVGGHAIERCLDTVQLGRIAGRLGQLWPPGAYGLGMAAARVVLAAVGSSRRAQSVLAILDGEFNVKRSVGTLQALLAPSGLAATFTPLLTTRERVQVMAALDAESLLGSR